MPNKFIVIAWVILTIVVLGLDNCEKDSLGLLQLVIIDFITVGTAYLLIRKKSKVCWFSTLVVVVLVHILLLSNASGWNEGSMSGGSYVIPFLKNVTDVLYTLILFSAFSLLIPLAIYGLFIVSLINLLCGDLKSFKNNNEFKQSKRDKIENN